MIAAARRAYPGVEWLATPPAGAGRATATGGTVGDVSSASNGGGELTPSDARRHVIAGSHPLPDERSVAAADRALRLVTRLSADDLMLVLVSGGGSALWSAPSGIGLEAKRALTSGLQRAGADIFELNVVRRHLSRIKGGRLAAATAAHVHTLALSDVPGDELADVASGPSVPDPSTFSDALAVVRRYQVDAPEAVEHLALGAAGAVPETPKPGGEVAARATAQVIGSAAKLLAAAESFWTERGFPVLVLSDRLQGDAGRLAEDHAELAVTLSTGRDPGPALARLLTERSRLAAVVGRLAAWIVAGDGAPPLVLLSGGEATVTVTGSGRGGRNLEFAAWLLHYLNAAGDVAGGGDMEPLGVWALSAGSDGIDGSSDAAGAFVTPDSLARAKTHGLVLSEYLNDNDTDAFFNGLEDRLVTGPSGNNLNDYRAVIVPRRY